MNNQRRAQKNLTPDCSGHVAQANGVHEQVQKTNARPQGRNETLGHSNGPGTKKPRSRETRARGGTRTGFQPLQTLDSRRNIRNPAQSGTGKAQSVTQSVDTVYPQICEGGE